MSTRSGLHTQLCRAEIATFSDAVSNEGEVLVACTQEAPLFAETAEEAADHADLRFVNIRETAGWSSEGAQAAPKIAALLAAFTTAGFFLALTNPLRKI